MERAREMARHIGSGLATVTTNPDLPKAPLGSSLRFKVWDTVNQALQPHMNYDAEPPCWKRCVPATAVDEERANAVPLHSYLHKRQ